MKGQSDAESLFGDRGKLATPVCTLSTRSRYDEIATPSTQYTDIKNSRSMLQCKIVKHRKVLLKKKENENRYMVQT